MLTEGLEISRLNKVLPRSGSLFLGDFGKKAGEEHNKKRVGDRNKKTTCSVPSVPALSLRIFSLQTR